ncbi:MAG TPA: hypothetical protein VKA26_10450 [Ignavibacteriaceae bacterium]|nr:hypothetical protein [Ignavibacteriaceae bacterium]
MSAIFSLRKIADWVKSYDVLLFIVFIGFGWLIAWLAFVLFALIFVS